MKTWMPTSLDSGTPRWSNISDFEGNPRSKDSEVDNPSKWVAVTAFKPFTEWKYSHPKSILNYSGTAKRHGGVRRREHRRVLTQHSASKPRLEAVSHVRCCRCLQVQRSLNLGAGTLLPGCGVCLC